MAGVPIATEPWAITKFGNRHVELALDSAKPVASSGASTYVESTSSFRSHYRNLPAVTNYDEYAVALSAGTWVLALEAWRGASLGRLAVSLDGAQVGVIDTYDSGSTIAYRFEMPGIGVRDGGIHLVRFTVLAKNALSAGVAVRLSAASFTRVSPGAVPDADLAWSYIASTVTPRSIGIDGAVYGNGGTGDRVIARVTDGGTTVDWGHDFGADLNSGEYVIFVARTTDGYVVITSTDVSLSGNYGRIWFSTSFTSGFTLVQTIKGTNEFSVSRPEIGTNDQTWLAVGEYSTDMPQPTHYLWHSSDGGQTWRNIKTAINTDTSKNSHFHGCAHDRATGRLYSSQGDNGNSTFSYTDNPEDVAPTWITVTFAIHPQPVTLGVFPDGKLFWSPDHATGDAGIWAALATDIAAAEPVYWTPDDEIATQQFGRSPYAQTDKRAVVCVPDRLGGGLKAYFVGTGDQGRTWHLIHTMPLTSLGSGSLGIVGPDSDGFIYYKSSGNPSPAGTNLMVAPMPTFREVP